MDRPDLNDPGGSIPEERFALRLLFHIVKVGQRLVLLSLSDMAWPLSIKFIHCLLEECRLANSPSIFPIVPESWQ